MNSEASFIREERRLLTEQIDRQRQSRKELLNNLRNADPEISASLDLAAAMSDCSPRFLPRPRRDRKPERALDSQAGQPDSGSALELVKGLIAGCLVSPGTAIPIDSIGLARRMPTDFSAAEREAVDLIGGPGGVIGAVEAGLRALADGIGAPMEVEECVLGGKKRIMVLSVDKARLAGEARGHSQQPSGDSGSLHSASARSTTNAESGHLHTVFPHAMGLPPRMMAGMGFGGMLPFQQRPGQLPTKSGSEDVMKDLETLLAKKSYLESQKSKTGEELLDLLHRPTAKETAVAAKFKTKGGSALKEYCPSLTKEDCRGHRGSYLPCEKMHFRRIISLHTDVNLGDCSFLDTCRHMKTCKYVHYELDATLDVPGVSRSLSKPRADYCSEVELGEPQWVNCDIRSFKMEILGQFGVIMADPPWDIHMELPYGTMSDDEMRNLNVPVLQTDGLLFLWVTGRAMELGRECLELWGYKRVEELIWVKTNQLQRIIRTGRTGHWLNHSKEHCLVGIKGNPEVNRNIDTDVIVAEVRETSRKPDEMYPMLERISPRTRKLELFARMHNTHAGWISLGNQLNGVRLVDDNLRRRFKAAYPDVEVHPPNLSFGTETSSSQAPLLV
ncbi:probable N6-adenosine-methyltransferase MT-A70-like [Selaginella moellendorffii]|uniref:probable N6-adenosine-methyltransferase MT-A70-like n=1 Tax=Selaginella moellendorffii TaxID=88036 RepID=UPI000D1CBF5D|nr:probable N6-adenosine-methyltransferase MT-A70-like [Selaginella moellendorffii]|eukprot:XP_002989604.2 probable N6-adenosine-methyltransferase MT-A70-like [Selaginella moellendorffii]